jgi:hypothetical protein
MKKLIVVILVMISVGANAQKLIGGDHILKTNLSSDALKNYNLTFEKNILPFVSISASYRTMPKTALPLKSLAKKFIKSDAIDFDQFQVGNTALTFEGRFYLGIQKRLEADLISQRDYYLLSIDIFKTLKLDTTNRPVPAKDYLEKTYNVYTKLIESSDALAKKIDDSLIPIELDSDDIKIITPSENGSVNLSGGHFDANIDD